MRPPPSLRIVAAAFAALMAGDLPLRAQCAMCNAAGDASRAGRAFSISVLFLLGTLFLSIAGIVLLAARRARRRPEPDPGARGTGEGAGDAAPGSPSSAA